MQFNSSVNEEATHVANGRNPLLRRGIQAAVATGLIAIMAVSVPRGVTAQDDERGRACSNATLRGDYGFLVGGIRGAGPGLTESFVGTGLRTYDFHGNFTHVDSSHGQLTGAARDREASGTYEVLKKEGVITADEVPGRRFGAAANPVLRVAKRKT